MIWKTILALILLLLAISALLSASFSEPSPDETMKGTVGDDEDRRSYHSGVIWARIFTNIAIVMGLSGIGMAILSLKTD